MRKIEKTLFVTLALNALIGIYYLNSQAKMFIMCINGVLGEGFKTIGYVLEILISVILLLLLIKGLIICARDGKFKMNNLIKIPVIYFALSFVFIGVPSQLISLFRPSVTPVDFIDNAIYSLNMYSRL